MNVLAGKRIVLGVGGSIAAYKAADLASRLTQEGALVDAVLTAAGARFVSPLAFRSVTGRPAFADLWSEEAHVLHVSLGHEADHHRRRDKHEQVAPDGEGAARRERRHRQADHRVVDGEDQPRRHDARQLGPGVQEPAERVRL
ncbi:MAG TPA: flavoprotein, partial [Thermoanaerobaculia bacterium]|nr:flavoprotein [Thermoanaerobaculia bacterium]